MRPCDKANPGLEEKIPDGHLMGLRALMALDSTTRPDLRLNGDD